MSPRATPNVLSIPVGAPFLPTLVDALLGGRLVADFHHDGDPLALADVTIYVPTRRAARELRATFLQRAGGGSVILPAIRPLGEFDEDEAWFDGAVPPEALDPPIDMLERLLLLTPLVQAWKRRLPAHVADLFSEEIVVPASSAEAIWLARDLAELMDEIEREEAAWDGLRGLVKEDLAAWWQVTLDFLQIVTQFWPAALAEMKRSNPVAHRSRLMDAETERLLRTPPAGPVIAAGSTGSIPATARLLAAIARLPNGAVVLPGLDTDLDATAWDTLGDADAAPSVYGHPQFGLHRLLGAIGIARADVALLGDRPTHQVARARILSEALRPAETTQDWVTNRGVVEQAVAEGAFDGVTLLDAPNEREEALAIALALRRKAATPGARAALVTADRALARRVSSELLRFGIVADDSAGTPLQQTPPAALLRLLVEAVMRPGDPVAILAFLKQPLLSLGLERARVRQAAETIELIALRGGTGRPDIATLAADYETRLTGFASAERRTPRWFTRLGGNDIEEARIVLAALSAALAPLVALRNQGAQPVAEIARVTVEAFENVGRAATGGLDELYRGDAGIKLAGLLRSLVGSQAQLRVAPIEWPDVLGAIAAAETVKPRQGADQAVSIWGALEARLQSVDLLVCGGLNEGSWPGRADPGGFMSRVMKSGLRLDPPERRLGQAAHDFAMAMGSPEILLTRAARSGDAPSVPSRWLQRLTACIGEKPASAMAGRGAALLAAARAYALDAPENVPFAARPMPAPPLDVRPRHFSVTQIETLRRDPYAIYASKILRLEPLEPLLRDPGAAERGSLFHDILHRFTESGVDAASADAVDQLIAIARACFDAEELPMDVDAVWWPRFKMMAPNLIEWELNHRHDTTRRVAEADARATEVGQTGVTLGGRADRIDIKPEGLADILDYKTGSSPSRTQAHRLVAPQLSLEGALLSRGAFGEIGALTPAELAYVRLKPTGKVVEESILELNRAPRLAADLAEESWRRLETLFDHYANPATGYRSRALPFREGDTDGDYDHLARVLEWSAGGDSGEAGDGSEGGE